MKIPLAKPYVSDELKQRVLDVLDSGFLTEGVVTKNFETLIKNYIGCKYVIAVTSCTTGLELALRALNIGEGDEVIVPDYTYPATADVVRIVGATVIIVDIDKDTLNIDYQKIREAVTSKTKAVIPVSLFGNPLNWNELNSIKKDYKLKIIEDAACSLGAEFNGVKVGNFADISVFSFHPRKFITTGEGGVITTNDDKLALWMKSYKCFGLDAGSFERIGSNYKMSNILAALGIEQMNNIEELFKKRQEQVNLYKNLLLSTDIKSQQIDGEGIHAFQSFCILVNNRDLIMKKMREAGVEVQIGTYALHRCEVFRKEKKCRTQGDMKNSDYAYKHCLTLPLFHNLSANDQNKVCKILLEVINHN